MGQSVDYMYMDSGANATVGFGHLIPNLTEALSLLFVAVPPGDKTDVNARTASPNEITLAYRALLAEGGKAVAATTQSGTSSNKQNFLFSHFETASIVTGDQGKPVQVRFSRNEGEIQYYKDVGRILGDTEQLFQDFNSYPTAAQFGLLDMTFNIGIGDLPIKFPNFIDFGVNKRNWALAANENERGALEQARNDLIRNKFIEATREEPFFHDSSCVTKRRLDEWYIPGFFGR